MALFAVLCAAGPAEAQLEAQISELNAQALEAYQALDLETARGKLEQALGMAQQAGYAGPEVAQSFMNLGVVMVAGFGDRDQGLSAFVNAVCFQPDVQLDPLLSTPDVQQVYAQAQQDAARGACGPAPMPGPGGPPQLMPTPSTAPGSVMGAGPQIEDVECPPGVVCNSDGSERPRKDFARFFFNVQIVGGFSWVSSGMEADSKPLPSQILQASQYTPVFNMDGSPAIDPDTGRQLTVEGPIQDANFDGFPDPLPMDINGDGKPDYPFVNTFVDKNMDGVLDRADLDDYDGNGVPDGTFDFNGDGIPDGADYNGDRIFDNRFLFDDKSAWVPDGDSYDDFDDPEFGIPRGRTPIPGNCSADGKATGPVDPTVTGPSGEKFTSTEPTKYCVRVETPGIVSNLALRLNPGYFLTDTFALSLPVRIQFDAGEGSFSNLLLGLRGEFLFSKMDDATGFPVSIFFGAYYGQIQAKPKSQDPNRPSPWAISGPLGLHAGVNIRWRFIRNFGVVLSPEFDVMLPNLLFHGDLSFGVEAAF